MAKKRIWGEILNDFYLIIVPYHTTKFQKKILRADPDWVKIVNLAQKRILGKFQSSDFSLLIVPYYAAKF